MIESLTEPTLVLSKHDTEPMAAVRIDSPEMCGVEGCDKPAYPMTYCRGFHIPLCPTHAELVLARRIDASVVCCPSCAKGGE